MIVGGVARRGYILAGGLSSRFGSDKACHLVNGVPLAGHVAAVLRDAGLEPWLLSRAPRALGLPERIEPEGPRHPLWGVAFALSAGEDAFFCPCDVIGLRVEQVQALLTARAVATSSPLVGFFPADAASLARSLAERGAPARALGLPTLDVGPIANLNRPADVPHP